MGLSGRTRLLQQAGKGGESEAKVRGQFRVPVSPQLDAGSCPVATWLIGELVHSQRWAPWHWCYTRFTYPHGFQLAKRREGNQWLGSPHHPACSSRLVQRGREGDRSS